MYLIDTHCVSCRGASTPMRATVYISFCLLYRLFIFFRSPTASGPADINSCCYFDESRPSDSRPKASREYLLDSRWHTPLEHVSQPESVSLSPGRICFGADTSLAAIHSRVLHSWSVPRLCECDVKRELSSDPRSPISDLGSRITNQATKHNCTYHVALGLRYLSGCWDIFRMTLVSTWLGSGIKWKGRQLHPLFVFDLATAPAHLTEVNIECPATAVKVYLSDTHPRLPPPALCIPQNRNQITNTRATRMFICI